MIIKAPWLNPNLKHYTSTAVQKLINRYVKKGGEVWTLEEGSLGYGLTMLIGDGLKTVIIKEVPENAYNSLHTIRRYNKTPKKYLKMLEEIQ